MSDFEQPSAYESADEKRKRLEAAFFQARAELERARLTAARDEAKTLATNHHLDSLVREQQMLDRYLRELEHHRDALLEAREHLLKHTQGHSTFLFNINANLEKNHIQRTELEERLAAAHKKYHEQFIYQNGLRGDALGSQSVITLAEERVRDLEAELKALDEK